MKASQLFTSRFYHKTYKTMKIVIPQLVFLVVITIAASCAGNGVVEEEKSLLVNEEPVRTTEDVTASSSPSLVEVSSSTSTLATEVAIEEERSLSDNGDGWTARLTQKVSKGSKKTPILRYSRVTIQNDTPYDTTKAAAGLTYVAYGPFSVFCDFDYIPEGIKTGYMWTGPRRGGCLVENIFTTLARPKNQGGNLLCDKYNSSVGTTHADYFIILIGNKCCVRSSYQTQNECP